MSFLLQRATVTQEGDQNFEEPAETDRIIALADIRVDGGTQMRACLDGLTVAEYAEAITGPNSWPFPAVVVYHDGADYWLADGFHRVAAAKRYAAAQKLEMAIPVSIRSGTRRDAILHAAGANARHGLRRSNADKRRAVETLLRDEEWSQWSDREIARRCHVDHKTVGSIRAEMVGTGEIPQLDERRTADGRTMNTANIGAAARNVTYLDIWQLESGVRTWLSYQHIDPEQHMTVLKGLKTWKESHARWSDLTRAMPGDYRKRDLVQALANVLEQEFQKQRASRETAAGEAPDQPVDMPEDLAAAGWKLREVHGINGRSSWIRWWCYNDDGHRATDSFENPKDAIRSAYDMQRDLLAPGHDADGSAVASDAAGSRQQGAPLGKCTVCGRPLTDPEHAAQGCGPVCAAKRAAAAGADPNGHDGSEATRDDLTVTDSAHEPDAGAWVDSDGAGELDPADQERCRLTVIERALLELARSFGFRRFSVTVNLGDEESEWLVHAWEPGYPLDGAAHLHEAVAALREQLGEDRG